MSLKIIEPKSLRQLAWELESHQATRTIGEHQSIVRTIWGAQNLIGSSPREMLESMRIWYGILSECLRNAPRRACSTEYALLNYGTTLFALANQMGIDLDAAMALKYPGMCFYCHRTEDCVCDGNAARLPKLFGSDPRADLVVLPIGEWQHSLQVTYGHGNAERGIDFVMRRAAEEESELLMAIRSKRFSPINEEIADVLAWWFALLNIGNYDAAKLLVNPMRRLHLSDACYVCTLNPCMQGPDCPVF